MPLVPVIGHPPARGQVIPNIVAALKGQIFIKLPPAVATALLYSVWSLNQML
jgi:hypothetical protein